MKLNTQLIQFYSYNGGFWVRIMGRGLSVMDKKKYPPLFSERNGCKRIIRIGKWGVEWLLKFHHNCS